MNYRQFRPTYSLLVVFYIWSLLWYAAFSVFSSFVIISLRKRELVALYFFLVVLWVGLQYLIVVFPGHTHLLLEGNDSYSLNVIF